MKISSILILLFLILYFILKSLDFDHNYQIGIICFILFVLAPIHMYEKN